MTIVLAGGSGFIGTALSKRLLGRGHTVVVVSKSAPSFTHQNLFFIQCDLTKQPLPYNVLEHTDAVINLVGFPITKKWTDENKKIIKDSRVKSTESIVTAIAGAKNRPQVFICASATGFYGDTGQDISDEQSTNGSGFLPEVVAEWELAARNAAEYGVRVVCIRTAPVIGHGGMLGMMKRSAAFGIIPNFRKQDYWFSWISEIDIVNVYIFALETNTLQGIVNATAPEPILNSGFLQTLKNTWKRRVIVSIPEWILKRKFGEGYKELFTNSRVAPKRLADKGFEFVYPTIESAIKAYEGK
jgi:uncharacterized protein (TIGR01777 family)